MKIILSLAILSLPVFCFAQSINEDSAFIRENYRKIDKLITMRDGIKLYTVIYYPKDSTEQYPFLMERTPYSAGPYGEKNYNTWRIGPNKKLMKDKYIFVYQDVRGRYKSEGLFQEMTPHHPDKAKSPATDESSDTYDTVDWLLKNIKNNNGRVGIWGISYPGFYASASLPGAHPAIKAVSPQAPVTDEFVGDDCNHNGAFFLLDNFDFYNYFDGKRSENGENYDNVFNERYKDAYQFFLTMGPLKNSFQNKFYGNKGKIWNEVVTHESYDHYWKERNIRTHLKNIQPAVLVVGGWFDAEDLFGALNTYQTIEKHTPSNKNLLVMGPWTHGAWASSDWTKFGTYNFGANTSKYYQDEMESKFFNYYLKDKGNVNLPEATIFETGTNKWTNYDKWPPQNAVSITYYFNQSNTLTTEKPSAVKGMSEYISDPARPVPYVNGIFPRRNNEYMIDDQRFAAQRPDVLYFETEVLKEDVTVTGPLQTQLFVISSATDADFIVKLIDVLPDSTSNPSPNPRGLQMGGFQRLVRAEVMRGKFRNSYERPEPLPVNKPATINFSLNDIAHTFLKGHRIMVQVQSSWFPLVDRNPQKFLSIPKANSSDFQKASITILHNAKYSSKIVLPVLRN
jgi:putative CocE/NonD family hydrolase